MVSSTPALMSHAKNPTGGETDNLDGRSSADMARNKAPATRLWREIALVLAVKCLALVALYLLFFAEPPPARDLPRHLFMAETAP